MPLFSVGGGATTKTAAFVDSDFDLVVSGDDTIDHICVMDPDEGFGQTSVEIYKLEGSGEQARLKPLCNGTCGGRSIFQSTLRSIPVRPGDLIRIRLNGPLATTAIIEAYP